MNKNSVVRFLGFISVLTLIVLGFSKGIDLWDNNTRMKINKEILKNTPLSSLYIKVDGNVTQYKLTSISKDSTKIISGNYVFDIEKIKLEIID